MPVQLSSRALTPGQGSSSEALSRVQETLCVLENLYLLLLLGSSWKEAIFGLSIKGSSSTGVSPPQRAILAGYKHSTGYNTEDPPLLCT